MTEPHPNVVEYIEQTFLSTVDEIQKRPFGHPKITLQRIVRGQSQQVKERQITYSWPGKTADEGHRFTCVGRILSDIYDALQQGTIITKREIYYRDPELYGKQSLVDRYVDDIAYTCKVTRHDLNVVSRMMTGSPKGLHSGLKEIQGTFETIPDPTPGLQQEDIAEIKWILVVEKESTFRYLAERHFHTQSSRGRGLLVTAKGYPDLATRRFLRVICDLAAASISQAPLLGLFDADPDGINIMQVYRVGSDTLPHERATALPEMRWLGLHMDDIVAGDGDQLAILKLTQRDRKKAVAMLSRFAKDTREGVMESKYKVELQRMLMLNCKVETQILEDRDGGLEGWLEDRTEHVM